MEVLKRLSLIALLYCINTYVLEIFVLSFLKQTMKSVMDTVVKIIKHMKMLCQFAKLLKQIEDTEYNDLVFWAMKVITKIYCTVNLNSIFS